MCTGENISTQWFIRNLALLVMMREIDAVNWERGQTAHTAVCLLAMK